MECAVKTNEDRKYNHVCTIITMESVVETKYYILTDNDFLPCANQGDHNICIFFIWELRFCIMLMRTLSIAWNLWEYVSTPFKHMHFMWTIKSKAGQFTWSGSFTSLHTSYIGLDL